ncbi:MAG TPA: hypothetical protein VNT55_00890, partial [Baekduia sp.]|nr:hypothetical protein [Baekduia sp.]
MPRLAALILLIAVALPAAAAQADWSAPRTVAAHARVLALAAPGDRPAVLVDQTAGATHRVRLLTTDARGRTRVARTYASPAQPFGGHLWATSRGDLVAAWSDHPRGGGRRVVVATGASLQRRQVLATDVEDVRGLDLAVNARGDALAVFVRRAGDTRTLAV